MISKVAVVTVIGGSVAAVAGTAVSQNIADGRGDQIDQTMVESAGTCRYDECLGER